VRLDHTILPVNDLASSLDFYGTGMSVYCDDPSKHLVEILYYAD
jgi:catechol 2,3-dioxygenase-like lactoylglutathione lyase family enzyme